MSGPAETGSPAALSNPVHETDAEGLTQATGHTLPAPEGAENLRHSWVEQKISEHANASITAFYNRERDGQ